MGNFKALQSMNTIYLMELLKELREKRGLSLRDAAKKYGVGHSTIHQFEKSSNAKFKQFLRYIFEISKDGGLSNKKVTEVLKDYCLEESSE